MQQSAESIKQYLEELLLAYVESGSAGEPFYEELQKTLKKGEIKYSKEYLNFVDESIQKENELATKIISAFESRFPHASEEVRKHHLIFKLYQGISLSTLLELYEDSTQIHLILEKELRSFASTLMCLWFGMFNSLFILHKSLREKYKKIYQGSKRERILQQFIGSKEVDPELGAYNREDVGTLHRTIARSKRNSGFFKQLLEFDPRKVEDEKYFLKADLVPIFFEEMFIRFEKAEDLLEIETQRDLMKINSKPKQIIVGNLLCDSSREILQCIRRKEKVRFFEPRISSNSLRHVENQALFQ